jgi:hypothetical protein
MALLTLLACTPHGRRQDTFNLRFLSEAKLWQIHEDTRFTWFHYSNGRTESGLLLRWQPDSILIQPRGKELPITIPADSLAQIETVTGNRSLIGFAVGALLAAGYSAGVGFGTNGGITLWEAIAKFLVPPAIIVTGVVVGSSMELRESFLIPPGFKFDFEAVKKRYEK